MAHYFEFLRNAYVFQDLSDDAIRDIEALCGEQAVSKGEVVFTEGSRPDRFYIVLEGAVEVWSGFQGNAPSLLGVHGRGHLFGEMALVDDLPRSATVIARQDSRVLFLTRAQLHALLSGQPAIALSIIRSLSNMVRRSNESFVANLHRRNVELERAYGELKAAQEELIRNERLSNLGKFSSMILHDLRNPIAIIKGYADIIASGSDNAERVNRYAVSIVREAERLNQLANELLDYSRGEIRLDLQIVSLPNFFSRVEALAGERFHSRGMKMEVECTYNEPVLLDEPRMLRVFLNLADNARKAMGKGGVFRIEARTEKDSLLLRVSDTGEGMEADVLDRVFEPFYSSSRSGGTGLGMVIVKNVVEAHDGSVSVTSTRGEGTALDIRLPLR